LDDRLQKLEFGDEEAVSFVFVIVVVAHSAQIAHSFSTITVLLSRHFRN